MSILRTIDVTEHTEKKGKFSYLSWAWAVDKLIEHYPEATWEVKRFPLVAFVTDMLDRENNPVKNLHVFPDMMVPYMRTDAGYFVEVSVTVEGITRSQIHPVLNHQNKPINQPSSFEINTAIQRALAKAIALHGLGLYIYAGEDLPPSDPHRSEPGEAL